MMPEHVWLATGGKSLFNDRFNVLKGRDIVVFPDVDGFETWTGKAALLPHLGIKVSNLLQKNATEEERIALLFFLKQKHKSVMFLCFLTGQKIEAFMVSRIKQT